MNAIQTLLTGHLDIWSSADTEKKSGRGRSSGNAASVYGIRKLRELILELAVRGKLVPQDPSDEPASVLLEKIAKEKARLIAEGKIKKNKPLPSITEDEKLFGLPHGWVWVRLGMLGEWGAGATPTRGNSKYFGGDIPWFKSGELTADYISQSEETVTELALKECSLRANSVGDVLIAMYGATIGKTAILSVPATTNQAVCACTPFNGIANRYLLLLLKALKPNFIGQGAGGAQPNISREKIIATITALPPLPEQRRIVAKVDELMALCDQLEQQQTHGIAAHQALAETLLGTLTRVGTQQEFSAAWARIASHFDTLFTTEASIAKLKQTILQLAVMGKLVPQDPNDEPARALLKRIQAEKAKLIAEGKIKKDKPLSEITEKEKPFELPQAWAWARIGESVQSTEYGLSEKTFEVSEGVPVLKMGDIQDGKVILGGQKKVAQNVEGLPELYLITGDLLYNRTNSAELVGKTGIYEGLDGAYTFASYLIRIRCIDGLFSPRYLNFVMSTPLFRETQIEPHLKQQCGQANVNGTIMKNMIVSVPPLAEQHHIVAKVDELMALCDTLKARLADAQAIQLHLADAIVEQAVC